MKLIRIGLAALDSTIGAFRENVDAAIRLAHVAAGDDVTLLAYPEQSIGGYPPEDLVQWPGFVDAQLVELRRFAAETARLPTAFAIGLTVRDGAHRLNCAAAVHRGRILGLVPKEKLPTYNVFYEARTFSRGAAGYFAEIDGLPVGDLMFRFDFGLVALEVCEDAWSPDGPMRRRAYAGAELVANLSASPYRIGFASTRREMLATRSADCQVTLAYANAFGANDNLIFDGGGFVFQNGRLLFDAPRFRSGVFAVTLDLERTNRLRGENSTFRSDWEEARRGIAVRVVDASTAATERGRLTLPPPPGRSFFLPATEPIPLIRSAFCEELLDALTVGLAGYFDKVGAFEKVGLAVSGGRDSLLTLLIAHRWALRSGRDVALTLQAFTMPSAITSSATLAAAKTICAELGVPLEVVPIAEAVERELAVLSTMLPKGQEPTAITRQNAQARIRAQRMWNWANSAKGLWLHTGNMSEKAVGYTTIGGDLEGGLSILSNVPKTVVIYLLDYLLETTGLDGIRQTLATPAGPELAPNQTGEGELMPYPVLDACFFLFASEKLTPPEVLDALEPMFPEHGRARLEEWVDRFTRLFVQSIYKWVQAPLSLHVGHLDLERERALQLPVVQKWPPPR